MKKRILALLFGLVLVYAGCAENGSDFGAADAGINADGITAAYSGAGSDVMMQGFHWGTQSGWWNTVNSNAAAIKAAGITMVWLPPCSKAGSTQGYLPTEWYNLSSNYGTQSELQSAITALHNNGVKAIADIVINHRNGSTNWADFTNPSFTNNYLGICSNDEFFASGNPGASITTRGAMDSGETYAAARDLDHSYSSVQTEIKAWMGWLKNTIGFDGWRYDYVKGFAGAYVGMYNDSTSPSFSVGEDWPTNYFDVSNPNNWRQQMVDWVSATGTKSTVFDFVTKPLLAEAINNNAYYRLMDSDGKPAGVIGWWPAMAVTFLDNHDTGPTPYGQGHWVFPSGKEDMGYAYILTHPGTPSVFWPHYFNYGTTLQTTIKNLIAFRKSQGITSTSTVAIQVADSSKYAAIINSNTAMKIGPGDWSPGSGWTVAYSGTNWAVWKKDSGGTAPSAPTGVTVGSATSSSLTVSWTASSGATSYTVYRASSSGGTFTSVGTSTGTSFTNSGLSASTTYYYKVTATNSYGTSAYSSEESGTTSGGSTVTTTIKVNYDVGYGNSIYIRGSVSPLSWTTGAAATWTTGNVWVYTTTEIPSGTAFEFKALINNSTWSDGANFTGTGGSTISVTPTFNGNFYDTMDSLNNWDVTGYSGSGKWHINNYMARAYGCTSESVMTTKFSMSKTGSKVTLAFKYTLTGLDSGEYLAADVYNGSTWTQVASYTGTKSATNVSIDVTAYQSANFKVRFRTKMSATNEYSYVDNVSVAVVK